MSRYGRRRSGSHTQTVSQSFDLELETPEPDGSVVEVTFDRKTTFDHDSNYGADADGNRGMPMTFIDEDEAENIEVDGKSLESFPKEFQDKIKDEVYKWIERHEVQEESPEDYDPLGGDGPDD